MRLLIPAGFALLALIPILILIHSLKPKPRIVSTTTLFIWQEIFEENRGGAWIRQLRKNLPLLFQIIIIILSSFAISRPVVDYSTPEAGNLVLVIDSSASMKTRVGNKNRADLARETAIQIVENASSESEIMIIEAGQAPVIRSRFTSNKTKLRESVADIETTDISGNMEKALLFALSFINSIGVDNTIVFITDGAGMDLDELLTLHPNIRLELITGGEENIGITAFVFREYPQQKGGYEIMLEVRSYLADPILCPVEIKIDEQIIEDRLIGLAAGEKRSIFLPYQGRLNGNAKARLKIDDDFNVDNTASVILSPSKDVWIQMVSQGNYFLEKLLALYGNFQVNITAEVVPGSWEDQVRLNDIIILDGVSAPPASSGNFLMIDSMTPSVPLMRSGEISFPEVFASIPDHPILQNVDLDNLRIETANRVSSTDQTRPILESTETGLIYAFEKEGLKAVYIGFDLKRSNLPIKVAFPVLMTNIFQWLQPDGFEFKPFSLTTGETIKTSFASVAKAVKIRTPGGERFEVESGAKIFEFGDTSEVGIYRISRGREKKYFAVNLANELESDIRTPVEKATRSTAADIASFSPVFTEFHLWLFFALAIPVFLALETMFWLKKEG